MTKDDEYRPTADNAMLTAILKEIRASIGTDAAPITRAELLKEIKAMGWIHETDRSIRKAIEVLRRRHPMGGCIMSSSRTAGYWWSDDVAELRAANYEDQARIDAAWEKIAKRNQAIRYIETRDPDKPKQLELIDLEAAQ